MLGDEFGSGQVFWSLLWFFLFFIWIWILITVFADIFRSHDLSGWAKALWVIFVIFMPYLGVFVYLIARGHKMSEHALEAAKAQDAAQRAVHPAGGGHRREPGRRAAPPRGPQGPGRHRRRRVPEAQGQGRQLTVRRRRWSRLSSSPSRRFRVAGAGLEPRGGRGMPRRAEPRPAHRDVRRVPVRQHGPRRARDRPGALREGLAAAGRGAHVHRRQRAHPVRDPVGHRGRGAPRRLLGWATALLAVDAAIVLVGFGTGSETPTGSCATSASSPRRSRWRCRRRWSARSTASACRRRSRPGCWSGSASRSASCSTGGAGPRAARSPGSSAIINAAFLGGAIVGGVLIEAWGNLAILVPTLALGVIAVLRDRLAPAG